MGRKHLGTEDYWAVSKASTWSAQKILNWDTLIYKRHRLVWNRNSCQIPPRNFVQPAVGETVNEGFPQGGTLSNCAFKLSVFKFSLVDFMCILCVFLFLHICPCVREGVGVRVPRQLKEREMQASNGSSDRTAGWHAQWGRDSQRKLVCLRIEPVEAFVGKESLQYIFPPAVPCLLELPY